jgi:nucleotide-binding universal stress UspA family protein
LTIAQLIRTLGFVPVDFSIYSRRALEFATRLVANGDFVVLRAYDLPSTGSLPDVQIRHADLLQGEIREQMEALLRDVPEGPRRLRPEVRLGAPVQTVEAAVDEFHPDLLVVGTHGRTGVAHALLGSVAERLLRRPRCDILAIGAWRSVSTARYARNPLRPLALCKLRPASLSGTGTVATQPPGSG